MNLLGYPGARTAQQILLERLHAHQGLAFLVAPRPTDRALEKDLESVGEFAREIIRPKVRDPVDVERDAITK